ncbi:MAG: NFACT family protein [Candidatus Scatovivens sp.]
MSFDGIVAKSVIAELNHVLIGSKVNKIYQPNKNEIFLNLYNNGENYSLNISCNPDFCRMCLTKFHKTNPTTALNFCMLLRKYLVGAKIISISTFDLERTIQIKFECFNELNDLVERNLYIEIMSRQSNIVLTNENNIIIDSLKHFDKSLPAHIFEFAKISKESFVTLNNFDDFLKIVNSTKNHDIISILTNTFIGFSKSSISSYLNILNIDNKNYSVLDLEKLYNYLKELIYNINFGKIELVENNGNFYINSNTNKNYFENLDINYNIDKIYYLKEEETSFKSAKNNLLKVILSTSKKVSKKLDNINKKLDECKNMDSYRLYGELLTSNLYRINANFNLDKIEIENYYDNNNLITIPLDKTVSVQKNIEKFFKKYNKLKNTLEIVGNQKQEVIQEINYIESIVYSLEKVKNFDDLNDIYLEISQSSNQKATNNNKVTKKVNNSPSLECINIDGYNVYYGKNNIQNSYLTLKFASKKDIWFHVQKLHGSHVVLKVNNSDEEIPENVIFECAKLAKENSKAATSLNVPVDYCKIKFVKKAPGGKPGMVHYTNYKTIIVK